MRLTHADLGTFAYAVAARLPGEWTSEYARHDAYEDQFRTTEHLWDLSHVDYIVSHLVVGHEAVLHGPDGQRLYLTDRPSHPHQFVVAPLAPEVDSHHFLGVTEPNGIAVPADAARAAAQIAQRLLPRYERARGKVLRSLTQEAPEAEAHSLAGSPPEGFTDTAGAFTRTLDLLASVLDPHHGALELIADLFDTAADRTRAYDRSEGDDAFRLAKDLSTAATSIRRIGEDLHVVPERMAALTETPFLAPVPAPRPPSPPPPGLPPAPPGPPTPGLTATR
ncbi:hypothetical protein ACWGI1_00165 [Streptomyces sp. NPDC054835]|uniref:hypothetical protein n=1 Tax=Streptomyces exfoliatus TaxID=1905 RepID=UPI0004633B75|nr:hypothetical protein [Streptomyces exfoliatus]